MKQKVTVTRSGGSVLSFLQQAGVFIPADCGGKGICGNCKVHMISDPSGLPVSEAERTVFSEAQLQGGWRLACMQRAQEGMVLEAETEEEKIAAEAGFSGDSGAPVNEALPKENGTSGTAPVVAVDLGTTTLAAALVDPASGTVLKTASCINHQRRWGANVISRIEAANGGAGPLLMRAVRKDIRTLAENLGVSFGETTCIISGNTTMQHLLQGLSCETLGVAPYTPVDLSLRQEGNLLLLPGISTFVGADIVSGILACGMDTASDICLLVDLGTNGEMAIGNKDGILAASTAAGPAFEGGNIRCGMAAVPGAVDTVSIENGTVQYTAIGNKKAAGLCGTGVLEITCELLRNGIIDETGLLEDPWFENGFPIGEEVVFTQKDIREVQLAKAAVRAGIETLLLRSGFSYNDISHFYIAGGFGKKINAQKAAAIGLFPAELLPKAEPVGNSSLAGAVRYACDPSLAERFRHIAHFAKEISLADDSFFSETYIEQMEFPEV